MTLNDARFVLALLNEPSFLQNIGDKKVRSLDDARSYLIQGPISSYRRYGFGLYAVERKDSQSVMGICGLVKREGLEDTDLGFAFLPPFWGKGYAVEAASAVMTEAREEIGLRKVVAITVPENHRSIRVLEKVGLRFQKMIRLSEEGAALRLYSRALSNVIS
jgi:ribosomal-protein-alanine N-acetyltransferase